MQLHLFYSLWCVCVCACGRFAPAVTVLEGGRHQLIARSPFSLEVCEQNLGYHTLVSEIIIDALFRLYVL